MNLAAARWLGPRWLRARALAVVPLAVVVVLGAAGAMVALTAAERTEQAYGRYLARANVGDVVINPSVATREVDAVLRGLPGVRQVTSSAGFVTTTDDGHARPRGEVVLNQSTSDTIVLGSADGRWTDMDRPIVRAGRMPTGDGEVVLSVDAARAEGLGVGDTLTIAFWSPRFEIDIDVAPPEEQEAMAAELVDPIGVETLTVVGIVTLADEVLPDDLYPRLRALVAPAVAARYDCLPAAPAPGSTVAAVNVALAPDGCATAYRYYSLAMARGARDVKPALDAFLRRTGPMNAGLADIVDLAELGQDPPQYYLIPTETAQEQRRVEQASRPTVTALRVLAGAVAAVTVVLGALLVVRELRRVDHERRRWRELGMGSWTGAVVLGLPGVVATVAGGAVALVGAALVAPGPVGLARVLGSSGAGGVPAAAVAAALAVAGAITVITGLLAIGSARRAIAVPPPRSRTRRPVVTIGRPAVAVGVRAALTPRTAAPLVGGSALLVGAVVAAIVFGSSLSALVATPRHYGWPWEVAGTIGFGYGGVDLDVVARDVGGDPDVERWTVLGLLPDLAVDGEPTATVIGFDRSSDVDLPVLRGDLPRRSDEVALGATTASRLGVDVGDTVELGGVFGGQPTTVAGIVVFPTLGPFMAEQVGTGTGLLVPEDAIDGLGPPFDTDLRSFATFVGATTRPDAPAAAKRRVLANIRALDSWPVFEYPQAVRPPPIIDARSTRTVPIAVGVAFAGALVVGLTSATWASVRSRRRELAVLRALGFTPSQVRRSIRVQAVTTFLAALVVGIPAGVVAGRLLWRAFADQLGVVPAPAGVTWGVVLVAVGGAVVTALAAWIPARLAVRTSPAAGLREE